MGNCLSSSRVKVCKVLPKEEFEKLLTTKSYHVFNDYPEITQLLERRISSIDYKLEDQDSAELIFRLSKLAKDNAYLINGKRVLLIMGYTGSGKSTQVNFFAGCELEYLTPEQHKEPHVTEPIVRVKMRSAIDEVMSIGHSATVSMTVLSTPYWSKKLGSWVVDCAGYKDTRGFETNVANGLNMRY